MEIITKLQVSLCSKYNNGEIDEAVLACKLKYVKDIYDDMIRLKQSMIDTIDVPMDELCNTTVPTIHSIHKELMDKYNRLNALLEIPTSAWVIPDNVKEEHIKSVHNIMGYHIHLMVMYNNEKIADEVFIDEMGDACSLDRPVYKDIMKHVMVLLEELLPYPSDNTKWEVIRSIEISNILMRELSISDIKHEELQKLYTEYKTMVKQTSMVAAARCMASSPSVGPTESVYNIIGYS